MNGVKIVPLVAVLALAASACGSSSSSSSSPSWNSAGGAIAYVRSNETAFRIFPASPTRVNCVIPGALALRIKGRCQTQVDNSPRTGLRVTFTEFWPARKFRTHGPPTGTLQHSWRFEIRDNGHIALGGSDGDFPPQSAE